MTELNFFKFLNQSDSKLTDLDGKEKIELINQMCFSMRYGCLLSEKKLIINIMKKLISQGDVKINALISKHFKDCSNCPKEVVIKLAYNVDEVAIPILIHSPLLSTNNLLNMLGDFKSSKKLHAIAIRPNIEEIVSGKIISMHKVPLIIDLLNNKTSCISINLYKNILNFHYIEDRCVKAIFKRDQIKSTTLCNILMECEYDARNYILENYKKDFDASNMQAIELAFNSKRKDNIIKHKEIDQMFNHQGLNALLVIRYLCKGDVHSFLYCISKITETPFSLVKTFAYDSHISMQFRNLYFDSNLPKDLYKAVEILLQIQISEQNNIDQTNFKSTITTMLGSKYNINEIPKLKYLLELI